MERLFEVILYLDDTRFIDYIQVLGGHDPRSHA